MKDILEYKGYHTRIVFNSESHTLRGVIEGINDYVDFESDSVVEIEQEFHNAVDDYLLFCEQINIAPEKEYRGSFNVRISPELHKKIALQAFKNNTSLNAEVEKAIAAYISKDTTTASSSSSYEQRSSGSRANDYSYYLSGKANQTSADIVPLASVRTSVR